jgi:hypothetical protein
MNHVVMLEHRKAATSRGLKTWEQDWTHGKGCRRSSCAYSYRWHTTECFGNPMEIKFRAVWRRLRLPPSSSQHCSSSLHLSTLPFLVLTSVAMREGHCCLYSSTIRCRKSVEDYTPYPLERMNAAEVYIKQLYPRGHGWPLWTPECSEVYIGDVGFFENGSGNFCRLFNILAEKDDPINRDYRGTPEAFEPLKINERADWVYTHDYFGPGTEVMAKTVTSTGLTFQAAA